MFYPLGGFWSFIVFLCVVYCAIKLRDFTARMDAAEKELQALRTRVAQALTGLERLKDSRTATPAPSGQPPAPAGLEAIVSAPAPDLAHTAGPLGLDIAPRTSVPVSGPADTALESATDDALWSDESAPPSRPAAAPAPPAATRDGFEFQFGKKLPVWIGGIALALAGFYLVKYTIEKDLLTENVRILLATAFGLALALAGRYIRTQRPDMADGRRIAQALTGAAIADLYATSYAAVSVWHVLSPTAGFACMALVTVFAIVLSLRHGMPIALLGLAGGYLTPFMVSSPHPAAVPLFVYLYFLIAGFFLLVRRQGWWVLALPVALLGFLWVPLWIFSGHFVVEDTLCLGLFVMAVCATVGVQTGNAAAPAAKTPFTPDNTASIAAACGIATLGFVTLQSDFSPLDWGMYGLLGLGGMVMTCFRPQVYRHIPPFSLALTLALLLGWNGGDDAAFGVILLGFTALYAGGARVFYRLQRGLYWGGMLSAAALSFYLLGYARLRTSIYTLLDISQDLHFWGALALLLAMVFAVRTAGVYRYFAGEPAVKDRLLALFSLMTTAFISIALVIEVHPHFLALAFSGETLAVAWVYQRLGIRALRAIAGLLLAVYGALMVQQLVLLAALALHSLFGFSFGDIALSALVTEPLVQLGLPMLMTGAASWLLRSRGDDRLVEVFEYVTAALGALLAYYLSRLMFHVPADVLFRKPGFFERSVVTNVFFAMGLGLAYAGRLFIRRAGINAGRILFCIALFRTFWFDVLTANPLWTDQRVGDLPVFNHLLLAYGAPVVWLWLESKPALQVLAMMPRLRGAAQLILAFLLVNLEVRQLFHGSDLRDGLTGNAETYSYSAAWLLMGIALLIAGTARQRKDWRIGSLVLVTAAVGKVFLYDASELEGLFRVFSFMGLGLCMMGLSWFYTRFVFKDK